MNYVKIDQFDLPQMEERALPIGRHSIDRSIKRLSRLSGYVALLAVSSAFVALGIDLFR